MAGTLQLRAERMSFPQLFRLALKQLDLQYTGERSQIWLEEDPRRLHACIKHLQDELGDRLPGFGSLHFLSRGPFPYSRDVSMALEILQQSGAINRENPNYTRFSPKRFKDTKEVVEQQVEELFPAGSETRDAFNEFVNALDELVTDE